MAPQSALESIRIRTTTKIIIIDTVYPTLIKIVLLRNAYSPPPPPPPQHPVIGDTQVPGHSSLPPPPPSWRPHFAQWLFVGAMLCASDDSPVREERGWVFFWFVSHFDSRPMFMHSYSVEITLYYSCFLFCGKSQWLLCDSRYLVLIPLGSCDMGDLGSCQLSPLLFFLQYFQYSTRGEDFSTSPYRPFIYMYMEKRQCQ